MQAETAVQAPCTRQQFGLHVMALKHPTTASRSLGQAGNEAQGNVHPAYVLADADTNPWIQRPESSLWPVLPIIQARDAAHALAVAHPIGFGLYSTSMPTTWSAAYALRVASRSLWHISTPCLPPISATPLWGERNSGLSPLLIAARFWKRLPVGTGSPCKSKTPLYVAAQVHNTSCAVTQAMPHS